MNNHKTTNANIFIKNNIIDEKWYNEQYPDVKKSGLNPRLHFLKYGFHLKRKPNAYFDDDLYNKFSSLDELIGHLDLSNMPFKNNHKKELNVEVLNTFSADHLPNLKGCFDSITDNELRGWAIDENKINQPVKLDIYVNNIFITQIQTDHERGDIIAAGMGGKTAGFLINFPVNTFSNESIIDIRHSNTDKSLSNGNKSYISRAQVFHLQSRFMDALNGQRIKNVTVIVPVYNAYEAVVDCLESLTITTNKNITILMIDDCSPDERITSLLDYYAKHYAFKHITNEQNLGYTCTVNKAIMLAEDDDVVLLNSDTVTTPRWLENLTYSAYSRERVATVTAISDNSGAFSVPEIGTYNPRIEELTNDEHARLVTQNTEGKHLPVPTGNGFCLYIRRDFLKLHGLFNEEKYPRGYGEENDLCMRAYQNGWSNLICDKSYVYHKRSQSFKDSKIKLMEDGAKQLRKDYPEYKQLISRFNDLELKVFRANIRKCIDDYRQQPVLPRALFVISTTTGGTPQTNLDLMQALDDKYECMLLRCDSKNIYLSKLIDKKLNPVTEIPLLSVLEPITHTSDEYDSIVAHMLYTYNIELLHIRHIAWHSLNLPRIAKGLNIPVVYSMHDFYSICPTVNLKNESNIYCGGRCNSNSGDCNVPLWREGSITNLKNEFIHSWRNKFRTFTAHCDAIVSTDESAKEQICTILPEIANKFHTIPHGRSFNSMIEAKHAISPPNKIRVLVLGNISLAKGEDLIKKMIINDIDEKFDFHFLGDANGLSIYGTHHGIYTREDVVLKIKELNPHIGVVLSLWPETFCHTLTEMWAAGIPVLAIDLGAVGNRIRKTGAGWLVSKDIDHDECRKELTEAVYNLDDYNAKIDKVNEWQKKEGLENTLSWMAERYCNVYDSIQ